MAEYLAIKNWAKYQPLRGRGRYIFDYTQQDDEPELARLSFFQRGVYQEIRRYRGRSGKNMLNDPEFIASATCARLKDRPRLPQAVRVLIACKLLILTNQEHDILKAPDIETDNDKEKDIKPPARSASQVPISDPKPKLAPRPDSMFAKAYDRYPRHIGRRSAEKAWGQAVNREAAKCVRTIAEHEDFLYQRVMTYGAACARYHKPREFIPHMATWLNQDRFLDDPSEWEVTRQEQRNGNGQVSKATARERRIIESAVRASAAGADSGTCSDPLALPGNGRT